MPTVLRVRGYRFHFYANEGLEPPHIHVRSADGTAKFWLVPIALTEWRRYDHRELNAIRALVEEHREELLHAWDTYFSRS
ncbi:MAG TPA: DUF4160 domain-containing protein [Chloroflexota bacterium]|nr:DUF4160 domain-containing protein [Chloroflexota bacterium]